MHPRLRGCALKNQESHYLYDFKGDERYELDEESFNLLRTCTGRNPLNEILNKSGPKKAEAKELLDYLFSEGYIEDKEDRRAPEEHQVFPAVLPSLRYLQLHITEKCNLNCAHCYLGEKESKDLDIKIIKKAVREFSPNGLKVLVTGGEPLLHSRFWDVIRVASRFPVRLELLSNGTLITRKVARKLAKYVHGVQISLDGMKAGHDSMRGVGCFEKTVEGIKNAREVLDVNIATMIHPGNLGEFEELQGFVNEIGATEWNLDIPSLAGNATAKTLPTAVDAARIFKAYGYGMGVHEGDQGFSCGSHICTIDVNGNVSKCGFFAESVGNIEKENLIELWKRVVEKFTPRVEALECIGCSVVGECRGGCRYRALVSGDFLGKDPFMCTLNLGVD
jgi:radical SAM protein with 4Fe4S-binding SPASM domain